MMSFYSRNKGTKLLNSFRFSMWPFRFKIKLRQIRLLIGKSFVVVAIFTAITAQICCDMFQAHRLIAQFALSINDVVLWDRRRHYFQSRPCSDYISLVTVKHYNGISSTQNSHSNETWTSSSSITLQNNIKCIHMTADAILHAVETIVGSRLVPSSQAD